MPLGCAATHTTMGWDARRPVFALGLGVAVLCCAVLRSEGENGREKIKSRSGCVGGYPKGYVGFRSKK